MRGFDRRKLLQLSAGAAATIMSGCATAADQRATPNVRRVEGPPALNLASYDIPTLLGYTVEEYFISGTAQSYRFTSTPGPDGPWDVTADATSPYATRFVVVRPSDNSRFSGTVIAEWLNVSGGQDLSAAWNMAHREMVRNGDVFVGVSAQRVGVEGGGGLRGASLPALKQQDPQRYGSLNHPGDQFSFDIFSQVGRALKDHRSGALGPLRAQRLLGTGESQGAAYLSTYINAVDPIARVYDGYLVHSRSGSMASLAGGMAGPGMPPVVKFRSDLRVPVLTVIAETDLFGLGGRAGFLPARQPDTARLRTWEIAGSAHADRYAIVIAAIDSGRLSAQELAAAYAETSNPGGLPASAVPINNGPQQHYIVQAAFRHLDRWVASGQAPPTAPLMDIANDQLVLDEHGLARGGIRSPWVDVPTSRLSGIAEGGGFLVLMGSSQGFDRAKLAQLYPGGRADYLARFTRSLDSAIAAGFILRADRQEILDLAAASYPQ